MDLFIQCRWCKITILDNNKASSSKVFILLTLESQNSNPRNITKRNSYMHAQEHVCEFS